MIKMDAAGMTFEQLNARLRETEGDWEVTGCLGQRFIAAGMGDRRFRLSGTPGNALGAYLNGAVIEVEGNAQDAVGDTMNAGTIIVRGAIGDAAGYAMRGGRIYVRDSAGYRAGVHMKAYQEKLPVMVIGGRAGSFLGEYQAGGLIVVLGLHRDGKRIVGNFPCAGMHGGKVFLRSGCEGIEFPEQVTARRAAPEDLEEIRRYVAEFAGLFGEDAEALLAGTFTVVTPDSGNPYQQMYVAN